MRTSRFFNTCVTVGLVSLVAVGANLQSVANSQAYPMGPFNPADAPKPPTQENAQFEAVKDKFGEWFGSRSKSAEEGEELVEVKKKIGAGNPEQFDTVIIHKRKKTAAEREAEAAEAMPEEELLESALERIQAAEQTKKAAPKRPPLLAQPPLQKVDIAAPVMHEANPPQQLPALDNPTNPYSITAAQEKLNQSAQLIANGQYAAAETHISQLQPWLVDSTEAHIGLYKALSKLPSAQVQSELEKQVALEFAKMRDTATYQRARIHQARKQDIDAIKLYVDVVKSQPSSQLGLQAYEHLQTMGFTQKLQLVAQ